MRLQTLNGLQRKQNEWGDATVGLGPCQLTAFRSCFPPGRSVTPRGPPAGGLFRAHSPRYSAAIRLAAATVLRWILAVNSGWRL